MAKKRFHKVIPAANAKKETVVPYYAYASGFFKKHFGRAPSRTTLNKYLDNGYPIQRGGPYVRMPVITQLKHRKTTVQAMGRFLTVVRNLERKSA